MFDNYLRKALFIKDEDGNCWLYPLGCLSKKGYQVNDTAVQDKIIHIQAKILWMVIALFPTKFVVSEFLPYLHSHNLIPSMIVIGWAKYSLALLILMLLGLGWYGYKQPITILPADTLTTDKTPSYKTFLNHNKTALPGWVVWVFVIIATLSSIALICTGVTLVMQKGLEDIKLLLSIGILLMLCGAGLYFYIPELLRRRCAEKDK